jgi:hypothetical protein
LSFESKKKQTRCERFPGEMDNQSVLFSEPPSNAWAAKSKVAATFSGLPPVAIQENPLEPPC